MGKWTRCSLFIKKNKTQKWGWCLLICWKDPEKYWKLMFKHKQFLCCFPMTDSSLTPMYISYLAPCNSYYSCDLFNLHFSIITRVMIIITVMSAGYYNSGTTQDGSAGRPWYAVFVELALHTSRPCCTKLHVSGVIRYMKAIFSLYNKMNKFHERWANFPTCSFIRRLSEDSFWCTVLSSSLSSWSFAFVVCYSR